MSAELTRRNPLPFLPRLTSISISFYFFCNAFSTQFLLKIFFCFLTFSVQRERNFLNKKKKKKTQKKRLFNFRLSTRSDLMVKKCLLINIRRTFHRSLNKIEERLWEKVEGDFFLLFFALVGKLILINLHFGCIKQNTN